MDLKLYLKKAIILTLQRLLHIFCIFPIKKNKIFFCSFDGKQFSDSPKFISEYYLKNSSLHQVWAFNREVINEIKTPTSVCKVSKSSLKFYYHFFTSKQIVINDFISSILRLRKNQTLLNTWHGGGSFKTIGLTNPSKTEYDRFYYKIHGDNTTAYVLSSAFFGEAVIKKSFNYHGQVLKTGIPRNSTLFGIHPEIVERVRTFYNIKNINDYTLVLYAPTYRNSTIKPQLDITRCCESLKKRFGKPVKFIFRAHHVIGSSDLNGYYLDGTAYSDIQDLVYCCDILISDYSSCMWDFAIMKKPIFQYVPDLEEYTSDRNFLLPITKWNFIISTNNTELEENILSFNRQQYEKGIENYLSFMGSYDNKDSTKLVCQWLDTVREGKENEKYNLA